MKLIHTLLFLFYLIGLQAQGLQQRIDQIVQDKVQNKHFSGTDQIIDTKESIIILSNNDQFNPDSFGGQSNLREALIVALSK